MAERVLHLSVSLLLVENGRAPGVPLSEDTGIRLRNMGDGVGQTLKLLTELADSGRHVYLVEEPEADLHPAALRSLLELIVEASAENQFVVSTHSDLVLRELGAVPDAVVYRVTQTQGSEAAPPTSVYQELRDSFERLEALKELGYSEPVPFGWLVLEESSAQTVLEGAILPIFKPKLSALRLVSASGAGNVPKTLRALEHMVLFAHLAEHERHRAWVLVDGDQAGADAIGTLQRDFPTWPAGRFRTLSRRHIEDYYPSRFEQQVARIEATPDNRLATKLKGELARAVAAWAIANPEEAMIELAESAGELVEILGVIEGEVDESARRRN